ncbi:DUF2110 family protein [Halopiger xanaduensis]|uniref:Uncharacterized conserved protein UCP019322 n=1 Tax=Halopiger xanaduensis (strain DSM 18323 / JCM 14033 / SH-6) TaxID=797210 RepID=F8DC54_HALXS|nr:DUF2110 family protein [Halopiger xanaduensis]AEH37167.1 Uncharacterized conserved protein UCP019322 [Halopiger xanaduensis SH-6]
MVVLATKLYVEGDARERSLDSLRSLVNNEIGDLEVEFELGVRHDDFPSVTIEGEDATVARNVLREEFGEIVPDLEAGETYVGTLESWDDEGFVLDAGQAVRIPADELDLGPGSPTQIRERFGLVQHVPLRFVYGGEGEASTLADEEVDRLFEWTRGDGRLNVNSATRAEVRATLNRAGHAQDYVTVERLGLLEQSVICTDDTDPPGLLASVGEYLPAELRCVVP